MWALDHKKSWASKNWCFWTVVLKKTPESPLDSKEIKPVNPKGNQPCMFIGRTDAEAEAPIIWLPDVNNWFIKKTKQNKQKKTNLWCWEILKAGGEADDKGWACWMASPTQWKESDMTELLNSLLIYTHIHTDVASHARIKTQEGQRLSLPLAFV